MCKRMNFEMTIAAEETHVNSWITIYEPASKS